jgi:uncharacterized membrane protein
MKRLLRYWVIAAFIISVFPTQAQQLRSVFWNVWNVEIYDFNLAENTFMVQEIYDVAFEGTARKGNAFIENNYLDRLTDVKVYQDNVLLTESCSERAGTFCVRRVSDGVSIDYYFNEPITNSNGHFTVEYKVHGALRAYEGGDQLWWTAVPTDTYGFSVGSSTITVTLPPELAPREGIDPVVTYGASSEIDVKGSVIVARSTNRIAGNDNFEIRVQFPHSGLLVQPRWQADFDEQRDYEENVKPLIDLGAIALSLLIAIGGPLAVYSHWLSKGRDPQVGPVPTFLSEPPSNLPPAIVGSLVDESVDTHDILSTIIDLARREYLVIEENQNKLVGIFTSSEFTFKRTDKPTTDLRKYEKDTLKYIFSNKQERSLDALKNKFYVHIPKLQKALYEEMVQEGLFDSNPEQTRSTYTGLGVFILGIAGLAGIGLISMLEDNLSPILLCFPFAIGISGLMMLLFGQHMPRKSARGAEEAAKWSAFREYLENIEKYADVEGVAKDFDRYLPYAVAFGIEKGWIRRFSRVASTPIPTWYFPTYRGGRYGGGYRAGSPFPSAGNRPLSSKDVIPGDLASAGGGGLDAMGQGLSGGLESMSKGLSQMLESASRTITSTPAPSNNGSSGSWGGGGSSFSGGGSFGGGSSGGGSRGFG